MNPVRVYKTDVDERSNAKTIMEELRKDLPGSIVSIDLEDRDKVLRIEHPSENIDETVVKQILDNHGYRIEVLS